MKRKAEGGRQMQYSDAVAFHGHSCPGLAIGFRVAERALREFTDRAEDEELVACVENNSCAVDAIQLMTGCTFGKGNLVFRDFGKQAYTFMSRKSGKNIRIAVDWKRPVETEKERDMWRRYARGDRSASVVAFVHRRKSQRVRNILQADEEDILKVAKGLEKLPPAAEIFANVTCRRCGEQVAEPKARIRNGEAVCIPCSERKLQWKK